MTARPPLLPGRRRWAATLLAAVLTASCASTTPVVSPDAPAKVPIGREIVWSGEVLLEESLTLPRGTRLRIEPGTVVRFGETDEDGDGLGDVGLTVEGEIEALGRPDAPILFTSATAPARPGSWGEVRVDFGSVRLSYAVVEGSTRGLHLHFTSGEVADSILRDNVDGTRIGESKVAFLRCLFSGQEGKGFNSRASLNRVEGNWFRGNRRGVFLFEGDEGTLFTGNRFTANGIPFRLGDFYEGTVSALGNAWDRPPTDYRPDGSTDADLVWDDVPVGDAGPAAWPLLVPAWEAQMGGFVDAGPAAGDSGVWAASWSGEVRRVGHLDGGTLASALLADVVDAAPVPGRAGGRELLAVPSWDRELTLLDARTLAVLDRFSMGGSSPADDHRQSAPVFSGERLFAAGWNGRVRGLDVSAGKLAPAWEFVGRGPFRAPLSVAGEGQGAKELLLAPCEDGILYALSAVDGREAWRFDAGAPLLAAAAPAADRVYVPSKAGKLYALRASDGKKLWESDLCGAAWYTDPLALAGKVYQGDDAGCLSAFDAATGAPLWRARLDGGVRVRPAAVDGSLAVPTASGSLYLLDGDTGFVRDRMGFGEPLLSSPAVLGPRIFFGGRDGRLHAADVISAGSGGH